MQNCVCRFGLIAAIVGITVLSGAVPFAQGADPFVGTWVLNVDKSQFQAAGAAVRARTIIADTKGDMIVFTQNTYRVGQDGVAKITYEARYDGKDYPVTGGAFSQVSITRADNVLTRKGKERGMEVETATFSVSPDGMTLTVVTKGNNYGQTYGSTQIFEKK
ncbi:MAG: hypothetical protein ABL993_03590 [Vicinamibacterales bacterium]